MYETSSKPISLDDIPVEIIENVASFLPPKNLLNLLLCCRTLHRSCVASIRVWQSSVQECSGFPRNVSPPQEGDLEAWKLFAIADMKSYPLNYRQRNILIWLPQAIAFHHRLLESANLDNLWTLAEPSHYAPGARAFECDMPNAITQPQHELYPTDPQSMIDLSGWQKAQAGSFCAAAHLLFRSSLGSSRSDFDSSSWTFAKQLLYAAPWFQIEVTEQTQHTKLAVVQHTLGNQVAGLLSVLIREHMILKRVEEGWSNGTALPPSPMAIPFLSFMGLPQLFDIDSVSKFSSCHTAAMATPSFFEDGTWTGYEVRLNSRPHTEARDDATTFRTDAFLGFGADNRFVILNHQNEPPNSARNPYNICVKRHATFRLQRWIDDRYFALQTNCFQSARDEHVLQLKVDSWTGLVPIVRFSNFYGEIQGQCSGVITPFGLVVSSVFSGHWMWMWKREWSSKD